MPSRRTDVVERSLCADGVSRLRDQCSSGDPKLAHFMIAEGAESESVLFSARHLGTPPPTGQRETAGLVGLQAADAGFAHCRHQCVVRNDVDGTALFSAKASILESPLTEQGPRVWWELREFFYRLPWSVKSDDLSRWLRRRANAAKLASICSLFEVEPAATFRESRQQAARRPGGLDDERASRQHDVEIMGSTAWVLAWLLCLRTSNRRPLSHEARRQLRFSAGLSTTALPVLLSGGEDLPPCRTSSASTECAHKTRARRLMQQQFGEAWQFRLSRCHDMCRLPRRCRTTRSFCCFLASIFPQFRPTRCADRGNRAQHARPPNQERRRG